MYNDITLVGNLTKDIELKYAQSGSAIASTSIATSHKYKSNGEQKEEVCFIDLTFFGRSAEIANQYLRKGSKTLIKGRLKFEQWVDANSGQKRSKHSVIVETMKMLDNKSDRDNDARYNQPQQQAQPYQAPATNFENNQGRQISEQEYKQKMTKTEISDEQIPF